MDEATRYWLYSLGYLSAIAFTARFLLQWFKSEKEGKSVVPRGFWHLSVTGNLLLCIHSWIQIQYHVCVISACNVVIAWRNLNLMESSEKRYTFKTTILVMGSVIAFTTFLFYISAPEGNWFRVPLSAWNAITMEVHPFWHIVGTLGLLLFSSRFWVQWWCAEKDRESQLNSQFWWLSLSGGLLSLAYFAPIGDLVNTLGPAFGMIPYVRNLMLIYRKPLSVQS